MVDRIPPIIKDLMGSSEDWLKKTNIQISSYDSLRKAGDDLVLDIQKRYSIDKDDVPVMYEALNSGMLDVKGRESQISDGVYNYKGAFGGIYTCIYRAFFLQIGVGIEMFIKQMLKNDVDQLKVMMRPGQFERIGNIDYLIDEGMNVFKRDLKYRGPGFAYIEAILATYANIRNQI